MLDENIFLGRCKVGGFNYDRTGLDGPSAPIVAATASKRPLDASLPKATEDAVMVAVSQETDPAKLRAFAQTLLPTYPVAASVLLARAVTLDPSFGVGGVFRYEGLRLPGLDDDGPAAGVGFNPLHAFMDVVKVTPIGATVNFTENKVRDHKHHGHHAHEIRGAKVDRGAVTRYLEKKLLPEPPAIGVGFKFQPFHGIAKLAKDAVKVGPLAFVPGAGAAAILATAAVEAGHTKAGKNIGKDLAKNPVLKGLATAYTKGYQQANPAFFAKTLVLGGADDLLHHKSLGQAFKDAWHTTGGYLVDKAKIASNIAGVPPQATAALTAAGNLAEGKPLPKDILGAAGAVLGAAVGPAATAALQQGAALGNQLAAQGAPVLAQIAAAKNALPPNVAHAFDSGLAISTAQHLQSKGYAAAHTLMPDQGKILSALSNPTQNLLPGAIKNLQQALPADAANLAHDAVAKLVASPQLAKLSSFDLAKQLNIAEPVARAALASMSHEVPGAPLAHPQRLEAIVGKHIHRPRPPGVPDPSAAFVVQYGAQAAPTAGGAASYGPYPQTPP
jgi:hypothetical protein